MLIWILSGVLGGNNDIESNVNEVVTSETNNTVKVTRNNLRKKHIFLTIRGRTEAR